MVVGIVRMTIDRGGAIMTVFHLSIQEYLLAGEKTTDITVGKVENGTING
jgi:hypothetical protein